eukprot:6063175-Amphidinium_carterae.1
MPKFVAWSFFNMLNLGINTTGNYGFIGLLSTATNLSCVDDRIWSRVFKGHRSEDASASLPARLAIWMILAVYLTLSL